ncbi:hypothetical protein D9615_000994 [Tricholomella constricta]|uniref:Uncharacterized protein n=1 Tax=Tricholomella constricta TaxID=117010 RepID=A0A8H5HKQ9_9AGAR|nr:hypothetical protein D9615_000994 [Tricholomella constricta]
MARPPGLGKRLTSHFRLLLPVPSSWTKASSQSLRAKLQDTMWNMGPARGNDDDGTMLGMSHDTLGTLPFWDAAKLQDRFLIPFKSGTSEDEDEGEAFQGIVDSDNPLSGIGRDEAWIDDVIDQAKVLYPDRVMHTLPRWTDLCEILSGVRRDYEISPGVISFETENDVDFYTMNIIKQTHISYVATQDSAARHGISYVIQEAETSSDRGGRACHITMIWRDKKDDLGILRYKNETSHFLFKHAWDLEKAVGKAWTPALMSLAVQSAYKQIYAPFSPRPSATSPASPIIRFGNPALYRLAYIENATLYLSGWRSVAPLQAHRLLQPLHPWASFPPITQGHVVLENLAIALLARAPGSLAAFLRTRCNHPDREEPAFMNAKVLVARLIDGGVDLWNVARGVFLHGRLPSTITLGRTRVTGILSTDDEALKERLLEGKPWVHCLKLGTVWTDEERKWVVKAVSPSSPNEIKAMRAVTEAGCQKVGVAGLAGSMEVTVGEYRAQCFNVPSKPSTEQDGIIMMYNPGTSFRTSGGDTTLLTSVMLSPRASVPGAVMMCIFSDLWPGSSTSMAGRAEGRGGDGDGGANGDADGDTEGDTDTDTDKDKDKDEGVDFNLIFMN